MQNSGSWKLSWLVSLLKFLLVNIRINTLCLSILTICAIPFASADSITFNFLYGKNVTSMAYVNTFIESSSHVKSITPSATSSQLDITIKGDFNTLDNGTDKFNSTYGQNNKIGLNSTNTIASTLDSYIAGKLIINNQEVASDFALAHEHKSHDWWLATNSGARTDVGELSFLDVHDKMGTHYCLNQNYTNFQVTVIEGKCNGYIDYQFYFTYDGDEFNDHTDSPYKVESVVFQPYTTQEYGQVENVVNNLQESKTTLVFTAAPLNSTDLAKNFNSLIHSDGHSNSDCRVSGNGVYDFQLHAQGMVCGPDPEQLDFYVEGNLLVNGNYITTLWDPNSLARTFVLAHGQGKWWLGSVNYPFDYYGSAGWGSDNHFSAYYFEGSGYPSYGFKATEDNLFEVKSLGIVYPDNN